MKAFLIRNPYLTCLYQWLLKTEASSNDIYNSIEIILKRKLKTRLLHRRSGLKMFLTLKNIVLEALNLYDPLKTNYLLANHSSFISKDLSKAIMHRPKLRNQFLKL